MGKIYIPFLLRRIVLCLSLTVFMPGFMAIGAQAQEAGVFTIDNVKVDVTAESAVAARNKAFEEAQKTAFKQLATQLLPAQDAAAFEAPEIALISPLIKDFEITQERLSRVRYLGTYTFRFYSDAVTQYFTSRGLTISMKPANTATLVLPFYQWGAQTILWNDNNTWLSAWRAQSDNTMPAFIVPSGDVQDMADVGDNNALTTQPAALQKLAQRYGAGQVVIAIATAQWSTTAPTATDLPQGLDIALYRAGPASPAFIGTLKVTRKASQNLNALYFDAIAAVRQSLQNTDAIEQTATTTTPLTSSNIINARIGFRAMGEWVSIQKNLRRVSGVTGLKLQSLKSNEAQIALSYDGTQDQLRQNLLQSGIMMADPVPLPGVASPPYTFYLTNPTSPLPY